MTIIYGIDIAHNILQWYYEFILYIGNTKNVLHTIYNAVLDYDVFFVLKNIVDISLFNQWFNSMYIIMTKTKIGEVENVVINYCYKYTFKSVAP